MGGRRDVVPWVAQPAQPQHPVRIPDGCLVHPNALGAVHAAPRGGLAGEPRLAAELPHVDAGKSASRVPAWLRGGRHRRRVGLRQMVALCTPVADQSAEQSGAWAAVCRLQVDLDEQEGVDVFLLPWRAASKQARQRQGPPSLAQPEL